MTQIKKLGFGIVAVALFAVMALATVSTASAAASVTGGTTNVSLTTNLATGTGAYTALGTTPVVTFSVAAEAAVGETVILTAPTGWAFDPTVGTTAETGTLVVGNPVYTNNNTVATVTVGTTNTAGDTLTFNGLTVRPLFSNTVGGTIETTGTAGTPDVTGTAQTLTVAARLTPYTFTVLTYTPTSTVAADGSQVISIAYTITDGNGNTVNNAPVSVTAGLGRVGTTSAGAAASTSSTTTVTSSVAGVATVWYKGAGTTGTDTVIFSIDGQVATANVTLTAAGATAGTATQIAGTANRSAIAPNATGYTSPNTVATVTFTIRDANNVGVPNRNILISTNIGRIATVGNCSAASGTALVVVSQTGGTTPGRVQADVCVTASTQTGEITVSANDVALPAVSNTVALTSAGIPNKITQTYTNGSLVISATDANGIRVADGTGVGVTIAASIGSVAPAAQGTTNGSATFAVALTGATGNGIISVADGVNGTPALTGTTRVNQSVSLTATTTPTTPSGDGTLTAPTFGTGNIGAAVFSGGTIEQLVAQVTAAGGTSVWVQDSNGTFRVYGTTAPAFVNASFNTVFADGFAGPTAVTVVK